MSAHIYEFITLRAYGCPNLHSLHIEKGSVSLLPEDPRKLKKHCSLHRSYLLGSEQIWLTELHYCGLFVVKAKGPKDQWWTTVLWMNSPGRVWTEPREMRLTSVWLALCWGATTMRSGVLLWIDIQDSSTGTAAKLDPPLWSQLVWMARVSSSLSISSASVFARSDHWQYSTWHTPTPGTLHLSLTFLSAPVDVFLFNVECCSIQILTRQ